MNREERLLAVSLQGLINRKQPRIYLRERLSDHLLNLYKEKGIIKKETEYSALLPLLKQYKEEINNLLYDAMDGTGLYAPSELFGDKWDKEDPLAQDDFNQNLLAWFGFEETLRNIGYNFETLQNCI